MGKAFSTVAGTTCMQAVVEPCGRGGGGKGDVAWTADQITPASLTHMLQKGGAIPSDVNVKSLEKKAFGIGDGLLSIMYRLEVEYDKDQKDAEQSDEATPWPKTMVAKVTPPQLKPRIIGELLDLFKCEVDWYGNRMPERSGMQAPKTYFAAHGGYGRYILLMEDLAPRKCGDQMQGISANDVQGAVKAAAKLHAKYINQVTEAPETKGWVRRQDDAVFYDLVRTKYDQSLAILDEARYNVFGTDAKDVPEFIAYAKLINDNYKDKLLPNCLKDCKRINAHSQWSSSINHGDFRGENIFFPEEATQEPIVIDYQAVKEGIPVQDISYLMVGSMTTEERRKGEVELIRAYYEQCKQSGWADVTMEEILLQFQHSLWGTACLLVVAQADTSGADSEKGKLLFKTGFQRMEEALKDWNVIEAFKLRMSKVGEDGVTSKYTPDEIHQSIPEHYRKALLQ
jgi:hypothetical protein